MVEVLDIEPSNLTLWLVFSPSPIIEIEMPEVTLTLTRSQLGAVLAAASSSSGKGGRSVASKHSPDTDAPPCGAKTDNGTPCRNSPCEGNKRCALHKGKRAMTINSDVTPSSAGSGKSKGGGSKGTTKAGNNDSGDVKCGARTEKGRPCNKAPLPGNKRCDDHKGKRAM